MSRTQDKQIGEKLFTALRELEVQYLNGGYSVQTGVEALLKAHKCMWVHDMGKYLVAQSILVLDSKSSIRSRPYYYYNGPKLSVKYCNNLYTAMKLEKVTDKKISEPKVNNSNSIPKMIMEVKEELENHKAKVLYYENVYNYLKTKI